MKHTIAQAINLKTRIAKNNKMSRIDTIELNQIEYALLNN
jgi:hypothetical protein